MNGRPKLESARGGFLRILLLLQLLQGFTGHVLHGIPYSVDGTIWYPSKAFLCWKPDMFFQRVSYLITAILPAFALKMEGRATGGWTGVNPRNQPNHEHASFSTIFSTGTSLITSTLRSTTRSTGTCRTTSWTTWGGRETMRRGLAVWLGGLR